MTGAAQGIGKAIADRLAAAGARIATLDLNLETAQRVAAAIGGMAARCDVSNADSIGAALDEVRQQLGPIDILVNNAGIAGRVLPLWELAEEDLDRVYAVNLKGVFLMCRSVIGEMIERHYGRIINVASIAGKEGNPSLIPYSSTKAAVIGLTKSLAKEVASKGDLTVNSISPAVIHTPILDDIPESTRDYMLSRIPMGRMGTVEEVAALVHFLASKEASFTTGQCYDISGGRATY